jgi:hypothetical protein
MMSAPFATDDFMRYLQSIACWRLLWLWRQPVAFGGRVKYTLGVLAARVFLLCMCVKVTP